MKLKYYMCGLGSGIILAVLVLAIAGKISALGNSVNNNATFYVMKILKSVYSSTRRTVQMR